MYNNTNKKENQRRKLELKAKKYYSFMNCFSNDYKLTNIKSISRIQKNIFDYGRLYKRDEKIYSFTAVFLEVYNTLLEERKTKDNDNIEIDIIFDKLQTMIMKKEIITIMKFIDNQNTINGNEPNEEDKYINIIKSYVKNKKDPKYKIVSITPYNLLEVFEKIIDPYGIIDCFIDDDKYLYPKKQEFIKDYLDEFED